jgi:E3 ubiquitin-protein ligase BRE1
MEHDKARSEWQAQPAASAGGRDTGRDGASTPGGLKPGGHANGPSSGHATPNGAPNGIKPEPGSSTDVKPLLEDASTLLSDSATLERLAETRLQELDRVCEEKAALNRELDRLRQLALNPSEEALRSAPFFGIYLRQLASQASELTSIRTRYAAAEGKLDELRNQNLAFRDAVVADGRAEAEALRVQVNKQNSDLARLRGQRDEMQAELAERRLREENALGSAKELDKLAKGQGERIGTLVQEVKRLKGKLGAEGSQGRRGYLSWLDEGVEGDYVAGLEDKVRYVVSLLIHRFPRWFSKGITGATLQQVVAPWAHTRNGSNDPITEALGRRQSSVWTDFSSDLETQLRATTSENPNGLPTADMQVELEKAKRDLETYQRIFGPAAEASDLSAMASKLEAADKARQELELRLEQSAAVLLFFLALLAMLRFELRESGLGHWECLGGGTTGGLARADEDVMRIWRSCLCIDRMVQ